MPSEINLRIATYRKLAGFTQAEAAQRLGMKRNTYARMERYGNPGADLLKRIAELYGVSTNLLIYGTEMPFTANVPDITTPHESSRILELRSDINPNLLPNRPAKYVPTNSDLDMLKMLHFLTKDDQDKVKAFLFSLYKNAKGKIRK